MVTRDVECVIKRSNVDPSTFDRLVDEYREGRDPTSLLKTLCSTDEELIRVSAWILSEVRPETYDSIEFRKRLFDLTVHRTPAVRLHAFNALFPLLDRTDPITIEMTTRLLHDENEGVRMIARAAKISLEGKT